MFIAILKTVFTLAVLGAVVWYARIAWTYNSFKEICDERFTRGLGFFIYFLPILGFFIVFQAVRVAVWAIKLVKDFIPVCQEFWAENKPDLTNRGKKKD